MAFVVLICYGLGILLIWSGVQNNPIKDQFTKAVKGVPAISTEVQPTKPQ